MTTNSERRESYLDHPNHTANSSSSLMDVLVEIHQLGFPGCPPIIPDAAEGSKASGGGGASRTSKQRKRTREETVEDANKLWGNPSDGPTATASPSFRGCLLFPTDETRSVKIFVADLQEKLRDFARVGMEGLRLHESRSPQKKVNTSSVASESQFLAKRDLVLQSVRTSSSKELLTCPATIPISAVVRKGEVVLCLFTIVVGSHSSPNKMSAAKPIAQADGVHERNEKDNVLLKSSLAGPPSRLVSVASSTGSSCTGLSLESDAIGRRLMVDVHVRTWSTPTPMTDRGGEVPVPPLVVESGEKRFRLEVLVHSTFAQLSREVENRVAEQLKEACVVLRVTVNREDEWSIAACAEARGQQLKPSKEGQIMSTRFRAGSGLPRALYKRPDPLPPASDDHPVKPTQSAFPELVIAPSDMIYTIHWKYPFSVIRFDVVRRQTLQILRRQQSTPVPPMQTNPPRSQFGQPDVVLSPSCHIQRQLIFTEQNLAGMVDGKSVNSTAGDHFGIFTIGDDGDVTEQLPTADVIPDTEQSVDEKSESEDVGAMSQTDSEIAEEGEEEEEDEEEVSGEEGSESASIADDAEEGEEEEGEEASRSSDGSTGTGSEQSSDEEGHSSGSESREEEEGEEEEEETGGLASGYVPQHLRLLQHLDMDWAPKQDNPIEEYLNFSQRSIGGWRQVLQPMQCRGRGGREAVLEARAFGVRWGEDELDIDVGDDRDGRDDEEDFVFDLERHDNETFVSLRSGPEIAPASVKSLEL